MYDFQEQFYQVMTRLRANSRSRAAAVSEPREWYYDKNGVIVSKPIESKAVSSGTEQIYKCGAHDFETRNLIEFNRHIEGHEHNSSSRSASVVPDINVNKAKMIAEFLSQGY